jgi:uncharacterized protein YlbG (UPF0298 family)
MSNIHLASDGQTSQQKPLVAFYCDLQNVYSIQEQANLLLAFAKSKGRLIGKKVYYNSEHENQISAKDVLSSLGFDCLNVPCSLKNSADNQLIADCLEDVNNYLSPDIVILVSGDGDFAKLVGTLQQLKKKKYVIIFAQRGNVKQRLKELADEFHFVDELPELLREKTQPQINYVQSQFSYNDAIECLIEAIKTALSEGKGTNFSYIGKLMRDNPRFPTCKKFPSVCKPDGTTFSRFSKFVDAVVKEGKVRRENQELFLI